jgi:hypothetical protein
MYTIYNSGKHQEDRQYPEWLVSQSQLNDVLIADDYDRPHLSGNVMDDYINAVFVDVSWK